jgi:hypothetical protein
MKVKKPVFLMLFFIGLVTAGAAAPSDANTTANSDTPSPGETLTKDDRPKKEANGSEPPEPEPDQGTDSDNAQNQAERAVELELRDGMVMYKPNWTDTGAYFTFKSRIPVIVTVVDSKSIESSGSGFANFKNFRVMPGEQKTVYMDLESEAGDMSVTISNGKQIAYSSNPRKPIFEEVYRWMVWAGPVVASVEVVFFTILSIGLTRRRLKKDLIQVG